MTTRRPIEVDVYKTSRKPNTFLYVPKDLLPDNWPEGLAQVFLAPQKVMTLLLTPEQPLAAQPAEVVMDGIETRGYFLQLPPTEKGAWRSQEGKIC